MAMHKDELLDHDYDGIRELDNDLPPWWLYMFCITIAWAVLYFTFYHIIGAGHTSYDEYQIEVNPTDSRDMNPADKPSTVFTTAISASPPRSTAIADPTGTSATAQAWT